MHQKSPVSVRKLDYPFFSRAGPDSHGHKDQIFQLTFSNTELCVSWVDVAGNEQLLLPASLLEGKNKAKKLSKTLPL